MLHFDLSDEQKALQELARKFAEQEMIPVAARYDETAEFPWPVFQKAHEVGLVNLNVPPAYGGPGLGLMEEMIIGEELAWGCPGISVSLGLNALAAIPIVLAGSEEQKRRFLPRLTKERQLISYCVSEPGAGSDVAGIQTSAKKIGDAYELTGSKCFITNASHASLYVVFAYTDKTAGHRGMSCFVVERNSPGVSVGKKLNKMGQRASDTSEVFFDQVKVPKENLLGQEGQGFKIAMQVFDRSRPGVGISAVGCARRAFEAALDYALHRTAFGQPIFAFQGISFMIADMAMKIEAARLLCLKAAWLVDRGGRNTKLASYAKAFAADTCMEVTTNAVQVFGGYGYSKEYPVEKLMRDAKVFQIYEGTSQIQRLIIARELFKEATQ